VNAFNSIIITQKLPKALLRLKSIFSQSSKIVQSLDFIGEVDTFIPIGISHKRALIMLSPLAWIRASTDYPDIKRFNIDGFTYEMVKALNESGFLVDIVDMNVVNYIPTKTYDVFIGHGGNCKSILSSFDSNTKVIQYTSGAYWKEFNRLSTERYDNFSKRKNLPTIKAFIRNLDGLVEGEEYLTTKADFLFFANHPRTISTFGPYKNKFKVVGWAAYVEQDLIPRKRDFDQGRKNFIYVAGTGGNIQKGMDLLLSAFAQTPDLHLYIYCTVEDEVLYAYKKELSLANIHYIYHYRLWPFRSKLKELFSKINYTISAPIDTGIGTAFIGSLGLGFIPVGYVDMVATEKDSYLINSYEVDAIIKCIREVSTKPVEWCEEASRLTIENYNNNWTAESFSTKFKQLLNEIL